MQLSRKLHERNPPVRPISMKSKLRPRWNSLPEVTQGMAKQGFPLHQSERRHWSWPLLSTILLWEALLMAQLSRSLSNLQVKHKWLTQRSMRWGNWEEGTADIYRQCQHHMPRAVLRALWALPHLIFTATFRGRHDCPHVTDLDPEGQRG